MSLLARGIGAALVPLLIPSTLIAGGCAGPDVQTICEERESCTGGNEDDIDACVASQDAAADLADDIGCGAEYDAYFECFEESAECSTQDTGQACSSDDECAGQFGATCSGGQCVRKSYELPDEDACEAESAAFSRCFDLG